MESWRGLEQRQLRAKRVGKRGHSEGGYSHGAFHNIRQTGDDLPVCVYPGFAPISLRYGIEPPGLVENRGAKGRGGMPGEFV